MGSLSRLKVQSLSILSGVLFLVSCTQTPPNSDVLTKVQPSSSPSELIYPARPPASNITPAPAVAVEPTMTARPPYPTNPASLPLVAVAGSVKDQNGTPIADASIDVNPLSNNIPFPDVAASSDEQGQYRWSLEPGLYAITVFATGYYSQTQQVEVLTGPPVTVDFVLDPQ